jgi:pimeloyl-ACP methyl ester carboxylesterase
MKQRPRHQPFVYKRKDQATLRGRYLPGKRILLVFLSGFRSVHTGKKATAIARYAQEKGYACLRFDYLGHGISDGKFTDFRISEAIRDTVGCIRQVLGRDQAVILVGSSMGGWIAIEIARRGHLAIAGLLLIAPATNFLSEKLRRTDKGTMARFEAQGYVDVPDNGRPGTTYRLTKAFLDDAIANEPPAGNLSLDCPVRIIHGENDQSVPLASAVLLHRQIPNSSLRIIDKGDHRLSDHIPVILSELDALVQTVSHHSEFAATAWPESRLQGPQSSRQRTRN